MSTKTILGTVVGSKTLDGRWAEKPKAAEDAPAVITKPMGSAAQTPAVPKRKPAEPARPVAKPAVPPKPEPDEPPAKPEPDDAEKKASRLLALAKNYLAAGLKPQAIKKLDEIVRKYPDTEAAKKAKELMRNF